MSRKFISLILAASVAVAGLTAAPARADNDVAKVLAGVAAVAIIGAAIHENRKDRSHVSSRGYYNPPQHVHRPHYRQKPRGQHRAYRNTYDRTYENTRGRIEARQQAREHARQQARQQARQDARRDAQRHARHQNRNQQHHSARPAKQYKPGRHVDQGNVVDYNPVFSHRRNPGRNARHFGE